MNKIMFLISVMILISSVNAKKIYVSPIGNNKNSGFSVESPLQTLNKALTKVEAEDESFSGLLFCLLPELLYTPFEKD